MKYLFSDKEIKNMLTFAQELKRNGHELELIVAPDWNPENSSLSKKYHELSSPRQKEGYAGMFYTMPVYVRNNMEPHTCWLHVI